MSSTMTYRVEFVERTGLELLEGGRGHARYRMPLAGNENHVGVLYMGAFTVLAEATAAIPGISILDTARFYPIIKDIAVSFHKMAATDVFAEFSLDEPALEGLLADLERRRLAGLRYDGEAIPVAGGLVGLLRLHELPALIERVLDEQFHRLVARVLHLELPCPGQPA